VGRFRVRLRGGQLSALGEILVTVDIIALGSLLASCKPPSCQTADPMTDVVTALALIAPIFALAGAVIRLRLWLASRRRNTRGS